MPKCPGLSSARILLGWSSQNTYSWHLLLSNIPFTDFYSRQNARLPMAGYEFSAVSHPHCKIPLLWVPIPYLWALNNAYINIFNKCHWSFFFLTPVISHFILGEVQKWKQKENSMTDHELNMSMQFVLYSALQPYAIISGNSITLNNINSITLLPLY